MKKSFIYIFSAFCFSCGINSCSFLDENPADRLVVDNFYTSEELNLDENTLIIFTSDNGPWFSFGNHAGSTGGLREAKATTFEGGQRVPCIMCWKGVIPRGTVYNQLASTII